LAVNFVMQRDFDVIVIGAGGAGSSVALELARRGKRVLVLERFQVGHDHGSSHGHSRIFRFAYDEVDYARLAISSLSAWRQLEAESGERLLTLTGGLDLGRAGNASLERTAAGMTAAGAAFERLSAAELMRRFPQWRVPDDWVALHSEDAGIVNPTHTVEVMAALARGAGVEILELTPVTRVNLEELTVETHRGRFSAAQIVVAAGAWLPGLLPGLELPLTVTQEASVYFAPRDLEDFLPARFPLFISHESLEYGFPAFGLPGVKVGLHQTGATTSAETRGYEVSPETIAEIHGFLERYLPRQNWRMIAAKTCLYTNTPSHDFLIDEHPEQSGLLIVSPCSGHGFKFAPYLGTLVADRLEGKVNRHDLPRFRAANALRAGEAKLLARAVATGA
jgi:sarcosine oxidase